MTTTEHLTKIVVKCREKIAFANSSETALAGFRSTIVSIKHWQGLIDNARGWKDDNGCAGAATQIARNALAAIISEWKDCI